MKDSITVNGRRFLIERLLGKGKGGYSYLARDGETPYVVKQIHHEPCAYYQFGDKLAAELHDYERLKTIGVPMPKLLDADIAAERILKEYIPGDTSAAGKCGRPIIGRSGSCAAGTNIDYFPTNFVVREETLFYVDYECNDYMQQWNFEHWGAQYWSMTDAFRRYLAERE